MGIQGKGYVRPIYAAGQSTGTSLAAGTASTASLLPLDSNGTFARACMFMANSNSGAHIRLGLSTSTTTATPGDIFLTQVPIVLVTRGEGLHAAIRDTAAAPVNVMACPLEDA